MRNYLLPLLLFSTLLNLISPTKLWAQSEPRLVIDTKGHASMVGNILYNEGKQELITISEDKTIRFWDAQNGDLKKTLRGQIGEGSDGKIYSVALHPNGKLLAVGGYLSYDGDREYGRIRLIDLEQNKQIGLLTGHTNVIHSLDFSPDGRYLVSGSGDNTLRIWDMNSQPVKSLAILKGHTEAVQEVVFLNNQQVASVSYDKMGYIWDWRNNAIQFKLDQHTDKISTADGSPDGQYLATSGYDRKILIWDNKGRLVREIQRDLSTYTVSFSPDGKKIIAHGTLDSKGTVYQVSNGAVLGEFSRHDNTVTASTFIDNERVATAGGNDYDIYIWGANSGQVQEHMVGFGATKKSIAFSANNNLEIAFGNTWGGMNGAGDLQVAFNFADLKPSNQASDLGNFQKAQISHAGQQLEYIDKYNLQIGNTGSIQAHTSYDGWIRAYSYTPRGEVVVGYNYTMKLHDPYGKVLKEFIGHTGEVWAVAISPNGKLMCSASGDQTLKIWNVNDPGRVPSVNDIYTHPSWGKIWQEHNLMDLANTQSRTAWLEIIQKLKEMEYGSDAETLSKKLSNLEPKVKPLLTLFMGTDGEWVAWTPQGYYAASAGGERFIGWHINQGVDQMGEYYPVATFRKKYHRPELLKEILKTGSFDQALSIFNSKQNQSEQVVEENILSNLPPKIVWISPEQTSQEVNSAKYTIQAKVSSDTPITGFKVLVNGRALAKQRGFEVVESGSDTQKNIKLEVDLNHQENSILIYASNKNSSVLSDERILKVNASTVAASRDMGSRDLAVDVKEFTLKPNLYAVCVGVSEFNNSAYNLEFADDDAEEMAKILKSQEGKLYKSVQVKELTNNKATRANILDAFYWLEENATQHDMVMIFIASHGFNEREQFYILPHDGNHERLRSSGVDWADFQDVLGNLPSKVVLFLDACHSGQLGNSLTARGEVNNLEAIREITSPEHGVVVLSASTGAEKSLESPDWGHGAFTSALIKGLQGKAADFDKDGIIYLRELDFFVADEVKKLTKGRQHPTTQKPSTISRLPILQVK